jgi:hypothetical protein
VHLGHSRRIRRETPTQFVQIGRLPVGQILLVAAFVTSTGHAGVRVQVGYEFQAAPVARKR